MSANSGTVVDVGVNAGQTLLKVLTIDPARSYVGFEPQLDCCFYVDHFLRENNLGSHQIICLALGNQNALMPFFSSGAVDVFGSLLPAPHAARKFVPVRIGDEVLAELGVDAPGIIKVDVEGAETEVFEGLRGTLERAKPICFFEVLPNYAGLEPIDAKAATNKGGASLRLMQFFNDLGYRIRQIAADGSEHVIERFELDDVTNHPGVDYVAYPDGP